MRRAWSLIAAVLFSTLLAVTNTAQTQNNPERKVTSRIAPFYPEMAKHMRLGGVVKLEVVVRANGTVKSVKVLGGSPSLIESASFAVQKWRFEATSQETVEIVQVSFSLT
jgi:TonB family protein